MANTANAADKAESDEPASTLFMHRFDHLLSWFHNLDDAQLVQSEIDLSMANTANAADKAESDEPASTLFMHRFDHLW